MSWRIGAHGIALVLALLSVAGCITAAAPAERRFMLDGGAVLVAPPGALPPDAVVTGGVVDPAEAVPGFASLGAVSVTTSVQPTRPVLVEIPVTDAALADLPPGTDEVLVRHVHDGATPEALTGRIDRTRAVVVVQTSRLSWFDALLGRAIDVESALRDIANGFLGGADFRTESPECPGEPEVRSAGWSVRSSNGDVVRWCLGTGRDGNPALKVVVNRRYPLLATLGTGLVLRSTTGGAFPIALAQHATQALGRPGEVTLAPGATSTVDVRLAPGRAARLVAEFDGFAQALTSLQVAAELVVAIAGKFGLAPRDDVLELLDLATCLPAVRDSAADPADRERAGAMISACLPVESLFSGAARVLVGAIAGILAPLGTAVSFLWSSTSAFLDLTGGGLPYEIVIRRAAPSTSPAPDQQDAPDPDGGPTLPVITLAADWSTPTSLRANLTATTGGAGQTCAVLVDGEERWTGPCPTPGGGSVAPTVPADGTTDHTVYATATNSAGTGRSSTLDITACCPVG